MRNRNNDKENLNHNMHALPQPNKDLLQEFYPQANYLTEDIFNQNPLTERKNIMFS